jgi:hypothetical protein
VEIMARQCLFCPNSVNSREHIWSDWILEDLKLTQPIRIRIGKHTDVWTDNPEIRVNCVCRKCNNGWMSEVENQNKPHILPMMHGAAITLTPRQQKLLTRWAVLKAMVIDTANRRRLPFYSDEERVRLMPPSAVLPVRTSVWIGRFSRKGFHAGGTDIWRQVGKVPKALHGCLTTIIVGHLAIQALTLHVRAMFATEQHSLEHNPGAWDVNLLDVWPVFGERRWPPPVSFTHKGASSIGRLVTKWKVGEEIG